MAIAVTMPKAVNDRYFWSSFALFGLATLATYLPPDRFLNLLPLGMSAYDFELLEIVFQDGLYLLAIMIFAWRYKFKAALAMVVAIGLVLLPHLTQEIGHPSGAIHFSLYAIGTIAGVGFSYLIGNRKQAEEKIMQLNAELHEMSVHDGLTGVYNSRYFLDIIEKEFIRASRYNLPLTYIILDVDDFKFVNDHFGHSAGDYALIETARLLKSLVRQTDIVSRYGGDEFTIILPNTPLQNALVLGDRILATFRKYDLLRDSQSLGKISLSIGMAAVPDVRLDTCKKLMEAADKAMYRAKERGKDKVCTSQDIQLG